MRPVSADEIALVAAYACDEGRGRFALMADVDAAAANAGVYGSDDERVVNRVSTGSQQLQCKWAGGEVAVGVGVRGADNGMCEGAGGAGFGPLIINGREYSAVDHQFHGYPDCFGDFALIKIVVQQTSAGVVVTTCTGPPWDWNDGWHDVKCTDEPAGGFKVARQEVRALLNGLCSDLAYCLSSVDRIRLQHEPPLNVGTFTDAVFRAAGLAGLGGTDYRQARDYVAQAFWDAMAGNSKNASTSRMDFASVRAYEGEWSLIPELSFIEEGEERSAQTVSISVQDQNVTIRTNSIMPGGELRSVEIGGPLDGNWHPTAPLTAEKSFTHISSSALEYALFLNDENLSYLRWQVSADGTLLTLLRTGKRPGGRSDYSAQVYRKVN